MQGGDDPVLGAALAHRHVEDAHLPGAVVHGDDAVEELGEHQGFDGALREGSDVEQARGDDGAGFDRGHAGERQEDALTRAHLDDESDDVGLGFQPKDDNDVVNRATWSPKGSKTPVPASFPMYTRRPLVPSSIDAMLT